MTAPNPTAPFGTNTVVAERVLRMKRAAIERDQHMVTIGLIRQGRPEILFPELFNDTYRRQVTANFIDIAARDLAEMVAPLPSLNCSSRSMKTEADKKRAAKKNMIGSYYWRQARLSDNMITAADRLISYGFLPLYTEPDYARGMPMIRVEDPLGAYYELDRYGDCLRFAKCWYETVDSLCAQFPEHEGVLRYKLDGYGRLQLCRGDERVEVVRYCDADQWIMFVPTRSNMTLVQYPNLTGKCPVAIAVRPGLFPGEGAFDQIIWVQLARHRMALLAIEAGVKSVGAPLAVPRDVVEMAVGPDSVLQTDQPQNIRRIGYDVPQDAFAINQALDQDLRTGARYPEGRASGIDASVITGRGVQALQGSFDTQISTYQNVLGLALKKATEFAFEMDEKVWPSRRKEIQGVISGEPFEISYVPAKDIAGNWTVDVTYGLAAGLSPNNAIVMLLQLRGDQLIDRATVQRQLPFDLNVEQMSRDIDVEQTRDALKQGLSALLQGLAPLIAQGQDPRPYLLAGARVVRGRANGEALEDVMLDAFDPKNMQPPPAEGDQQAQDGSAGVTGPGGQLAPGADASAPGAADVNNPLPDGVAPGQAGMPPGGQPSIQMLVAGMRNGKAQMNAQVSRRIPVGA